MLSSVVIQCLIFFKTSIMVADPFAFNIFRVYWPFCGVLICKLRLVLMFYITNVRIKLKSHNFSSKNNWEMGNLNSFEEPAG